MIKEGIIIILKTSYFKLETLVARLQLRRIAFLTLCACGTPCGVNDKRFPFAFGVWERLCSISSGYLNATFFIDCQFSTDTGMLSFYFLAYTISTVNRTFNRREATTTKMLISIKSFNYVSGQVLEASIFHLCASCSVKCFWVWFQKLASLKIFDQRDWGFLWGNGAFIVCFFQGVKSLPYSYQPEYFLAHSCILRAISFILWRIFLIGLLL